MNRYLVSIALILIVITASASWFFYDYWIHRFDEVIARQARVYRIDEQLVWSLIYEESFFRSGARGEADEVGLMQVTPLVAKEWAQETGLTEIERQVNNNVYQFLSDPENNLRVGCWYYEKLRERYRGYPAETAMTLAAYNAGASRVEEWSREASLGTLSEAAFVERIAIPSTREYVLSILARYRKSAKK